MQAIRRSLISISNYEPELKILVQEEKDTILALSKLSTELKESSKFLKKTFMKDHPDIKDITEKFEFFGGSLADYLEEQVKNLRDYRSCLKKISEKQIECQELTNKVQKKKDEHKRIEATGKGLHEINIELTELEANLLHYTATFEADKRALLKKGFMSQYNGWCDLGMKIQTCGHFGMALANQIPDLNVAPGVEIPAFMGAATTQQIKFDFTKAIETLARRSSVKQPISSTASLPNMRPFDELPNASSSSQRAVYQQGSKGYEPPLDSPALIDQYSQHYTLPFRG